MSHLRHVDSLVVRRNVRSLLRRLTIAVVIAHGVLALLLSGCGTTKWSDTSRTATEQLLLTNAMDRAVGQLSFTALYGKSTWIDSKAIDAATDSKYFISAVRQHLLASGARVMDKEDDADYVVELRAGAVGTDRNDLFYGVPSFSVPTGWASDYLSGTTSVPEIAIYKRTDQRAIVKVAVFAYNKKTKAPIWQSGNIQTESRVRARWILGAGPFSIGDICEGTELAGSRLNPTITEIIDLEASRPGETMPAPSVTLPVFYTEHDEDENEAENPGAIPTPTLSSPVSSDESDKQEEQEQILAAGTPATTNAAATQNQPPPPMATLASGSENAAATGEGGIMFASANANREPVAMVYPPAYQPLPVHVPSATALPWQNAEPTDTSQLAPGFGGYFR